MAKRGQGEGSIYKRPDGLWSARISVGKDENGKTKRKAFYGKTRKEVQDKMTEALNEINKGTFVEPSAMTVEEWFTFWLEEYKRNTVKLGTYQRYWYDFHKLIFPKLGAIKLKDLRVEMIQRFINEMHDGGYAFKSVQSALAGISIALKQAVKNGMIVKNVAADVVLPRAKQATNREIFTPQEQEQFVKHSKGTMYGDAFILMLGTGLRIGELAALEWSDVDFDKGEISINKTLVAVRKCGNVYAKHHYVVDEPKTKSSNRKIPLLPSLIEALRGLKAEQEAIELPCDTDSVFRNSHNRRFDPGTMRWHFKNLLKESDVQRTLTPHSLRHTFATRGLEKGVPLKVMQELLGHSTMSMTADLYTHVLPDTKKDAIMKLEDTIQI